jgi:hypothetical protein
MAGMNRTHHFIVTWSEIDGWTHDLSTEMAVLPDGTIYDNDVEQWEVATEEEYEPVRLMLDAMLRRENESAVLSSEVEE